jgi:tetratricopeptide (TPR) repeat protein
VRYKSIIGATGGEMEESLMEDVEEIDTIIAELEISKGRGNLVLCVVNTPAYRDRIIQTLRGRFLSEVISVEKGEEIIRNLKSRDFDGADILIWVMPEEPTEDLLNTLNNFRELFYEVKIPNLVFYNQAFSESVIRKAPDFWRYRGNYYELKEAERGMAFEAIETLATPFSYQDKEDLIRRKRINEYLLKKIRDKEEKAKILSELGVIFYHLGELEKALEYYEQALKLHEELGRKEGMAANYGNMGLVYWIKGELEKALEYYERALELDEELGRKEGMAIQFGNIGIVYQFKGELEKALEYYERALELDEELGRKEGIAIQLGNIGIVYKHKGELEKALKCHEKALKLDEELGKKEGIAADYANMGIVYQDKGELEKALEYFEKALRIYEDMGIRIGTARTLMNIGDVFVLKGDKERAFDYYSEAQGLAAGSYIFESISKRLKRLKREQKD